MCVPLAYSCHDDLDESNHAAFPAVLDNFALFEDHSVIEGLARTGFGARVNMFVDDDVRRDLTETIHTIRRWARHDYY